MNKKLGKVIAVTNQKGGVGKTTITRNLAASLYERGYSVLMIDFDTQGHLAYSCKIANYKNLPLEQTVAYPFIQALSGKDGRFPMINIKPVTDKRLDLMPANKTLYQVADKLNEFPKQVRYLALKCIVDQLRVHYDYIMIDTAPTLSSLLQNAIVAADECLLVSTPETLSYDGVIESCNTIRSMAHLSGTEIGIKGIIVNDYTLRRAKQDFVVAQLRELCQKQGIYMFETLIPRAVSIEEATAAGESIIEYKDKSDAALNAYVSITNEFIKLETNARK